MRGFTLVELMLVVAILGLLATVVALSVDRNQDDAMRRLVVADMSTLKQALSSYKLDHGTYPQDLNALYEGTDPYLENPPPLDPWGFEYLLEQVDGRVVLVSYGADGAPGGEGIEADLDSRQLLRRQARERPS